MKKLVVVLLISILGILTSCGNQQELKNEKNNSVSNPIVKEVSKEEKDVKIKKEVVVENTGSTLSGEVLDSISDEVNEENKENVASGEILDISPNVPEEGATGAVEKVENIKK